LGSHNVRLTAAEEPTRVEVTSFDYTVHPDWASLRIRNDVALIKLPAPIEFTRKNISTVIILINRIKSNIICLFLCVTAEIQPICMAPSTEPDHVGDILHNSGWGKPSDSKT
jgi:hypothetical protein